MNVMDKIWDRKSFEVGGTITWSVLVGSYNKYTIIWSVQEGSYNKYAITWSVLEGSYNK